MEMAGNLNDKIEIFFSYSHQDETMREQLEKHLSTLRRQNIINEWHDRKIMPGTEWGSQIDSHLNTSNIILLLVSSDFIASDYCWGVELTRAIERHEAGEARVIPIILRPCDWKTTSFGELQALPMDGKPVCDWDTQDHAFSDIVRGIRLVVEEMSKKDQSGLALPAELESHEKTLTPNTISQPFRRYIEDTIEEIKWSWCWKNADGPPRIDMIEQLEAVREATLLLIVDT